eukprot:scaffold48919_cov33-Tisochrysis_lutea.AAC.3
MPSTPDTLHFLTMISSCRFVGCGNRWRKQARARGHGVIVRRVDYEGWWARAANAQTSSVWLD